VRAAVAFGIARAVRRLGTLAGAEATRQRPLRRPTSRKQTGSFRPSFRHERCAWTALWRRESPCALLLKTGLME